MTTPAHGRGSVPPPAMASAPKRRKIETKSNVPSPAPAIADEVSSSSLSGPSIPMPQVVGTEFRVQQAKKFAVNQAQQEGCLGNFRSFDSPFGNFLVPVIPTHADLFG